MARSASAPVALALAMVLALLAATRDARAADGPPGSVFVALTVNGVNEGDVLVVVRKDDVLMRRADLVRSGLHDLAGRDETVGQEALVSLTSLTPPLAYTFDDREVALRVIAPTTNLPTTSVNLRAPPPAMEYRDDASGYVNVSPTITDFDRVDAYLEGAVGGRGHRLYGTGTLSSVSPSARGLTTYTYDMREKLLRFSLGDTLLTTGITGGGGYLGGASISRTFDLDPYIVRVPSLSFTGATTAPATLEVYMNGTLVRSQPIAPGTFNLTNLVGMTGSGTATYVVRDVLGHVQTYSSTFYQPQTALAKGLQTFTYAAGALRSGFGVDSWGYGNAALLAKHQLGVSNWLTLGYRLEAETTLVSLGPTFVVTTPIGEIGGEASASGAKGAPAGGAGVLSYSYASHWLALAAAVQMDSDSYTNVSLAPTADRSRVNVASAITIPLGWRSSVTGQYGLGLDRDNPRSMSGGVSWQLQIVPRVNLFTSFTDAVSGTTSTLEGFANVNVAFDGGHSASVGTDVTAAAQQTLVDASKPLPAGTGYGYRIDSSVGTTNSLDVDGQYQNQYARYEVNYSAMSGAEHVAITLGSALVFVPGAGVFAARTVQDAYAVVRVPGVSGVRVFANNQEMGRTDGNGNLLVPTLLPYYGNKLRIADTDVPVDYDVASTERTIAPPYRGAAVVTFAAKRAHFYRGRLIPAKDGVMLTPAVFGELVVHVPAAGQEAARDLTSPLGMKGEFEVEDVPPGRYAVEAGYDGARCTASLDVPDSKESVVEVGALRCVQQ